MVSMTKLVIVLLLALTPCLFAETYGRKGSSSSTGTTAAANLCFVTVSQKLTDSSNRYNTYSATVTNVGSSSASSIVLSTTASVRSVTGLDQSGDGKYTLSAANSLAVGSTYSFSYSVKKQSDVKWTATASCSSSSAPSKAPTNAPAQTTKAAAQTTKAAAQTTKAAAQTTKAPAASTVKATTPAATAKATSKATVTAKPNTSGSKTCASGSWWQPAPQTTWAWQLTGSVDTSLDVQMFDIDLFDATPALINKLHDAGKTVICYFSTQYENWRPDASSFSSSVLGNNLDDWQGEKYVDIRSSVVRNVMKGRLDLAASKGCDGVEPDNVDGYQATTGFPIKAADQLDYNKFLAQEAHNRGLSIGLKNDLSQVVALQPFFDWAINEQCNQYSECTSLRPFIQAGKAVFNCEYSGSSSSVCPKMVTEKFSTIFKALALDASVKAQCCPSGGCPKPAHTCVSSSSSRSLDADTEAQNVVDEISW